MTRFDTLTTRVDHGKENMTKSLKTLDSLAETTVLPWSIVVQLKVLIIMFLTARPMDSSSSWNADVTTDLGPGSDRPHSTEKQWVLH